MRSTAGVLLRSLSVLQLGAQQRVGSPPKGKWVQHGSNMGGALRSQSKRATMACVAWPNTGRSKWATIKAWRALSAP